MKIIRLTCPNCGAALRIDADKNKDYCAYCGTPIILDDEATRIKM